jgi:hypothetical protein
LCRLKPTKQRYTSTNRELIPTGRAKLGNRLSDG